MDGNVLLCSPVHKTVSFRGREYSFMLSRPQNSIFSWMGMLLLCQFMDSETRAELRFEPSSLRRHDVAGISDIYQLLH